MDTETAWAAGLFEGEGCVHVYKDQSGKPKRGGAMTLRMTDRDVVDRFAAWAGAGFVHGPLPVMKPHHKPNYEWRVTLWTDVERILRLLRPYMGQRRGEKMDAVLSNPPLRPRSGDKNRCGRGHPLVGPEAEVATVLWRGRTMRNCKVCARIRAKAHRDKVRCAKPA